MTGAQICRIVELVAALLLLVLLMPLMLTITLAILLEDGGPITFTQIRLGQHGRPFGLRKFRKFGPAGAQAGLHLTLQRDRRMTRVGSVLERTKLDELPQLWNILVGEMAFVGPRPESLAFADCFKNGYEALLMFRPGIFGPCQAIFRHESTYFSASTDPEELYRIVIFPLKASIDLNYYPRRTFVSDVRWVGHSTLAVFGWSLLPDNAARDLRQLDLWVRGSARLAG